MTMTMDEIRAHLKNQNNPNPDYKMPSSMKNNDEKTSTFLGLEPITPREFLHDPENMKTALNIGTGFASGMNMLGQEAKSIPNLYEVGKSGIEKLKKGWDYIHPEKETEAFRAKIGEGTSKENINQLGEMVKSSKEKAEEKGKKMYQSVFKKDNMGDERIYRALNPSGIHQTGFEKPPIKIRAKGELGEKVKAFNENPTLQNAHDLQSQLGTEASSIKPLSISDKQQISQYKNLQKEIRKDINSFLKRENPELADKYKESTQFWKENVIPYGKKGTIKKLASGESEDVTSAQIGSTFTKLTPHVKKVLSDLGPDGSKRVLYNAMQKVQPGDADAMAKAILDLKRTKGYDNYITKNMEDWAYKMQDQVKHAERISHALKLAAGATAGGVVAGTTGAMIGASLPFAKEGAMKIAKKFKK